MLFGLALVWLTAWGIAGYYMRLAGIEKLAKSDYLSTPATHLERGADVRVEGTIVEGASVIAPFSEKPCLAAVTYISAVSRYRNAQNKEATESSIVATRRVGSPNIEITVGDKRIELPLERWNPREYSYEYMRTLPPRLDVTEDQINIAKERLQNDFTGFSVSESMIVAGTHVFVAGRLEDRDGNLRLEADRMLERIELYHGTQDDLVKETRGSGSGLQIAGWILGAGLGPLPIVVIGLVLLIMRRKRSAVFMARG